jgi:hypothetical protein
MKNFAKDRFKEAAIIIVGSLIPRIESYISLCLILFSNKTFKEMNLTFFDLLETLIFSMIIGVLIYLLIRLKTQIKVIKIINEIRHTHYLSNTTFVNGVYVIPTDEINKIEINELSETLRLKFPNKTTNEIEKLIENYYEHS